MKLTNVHECRDAYREVFADGDRAERFVVGLAYPFMIGVALACDLYEALLGLFGSAS